MIKDESNKYNLSIFEIELKQDKYLICIAVVVRLSKK